MQDASSNCREPRWVVPGTPSLRRRPSPKTGPTTGRWSGRDGPGHSRAEALVPNISPTNYSEEPFLYDNSPRYPRHFVASERDCSLIAILANAHQLSCSLQTPGRPTRLSLASVTCATPLSLPRGRRSTRPLTRKIAQIHQIQGPVHIGIGIGAPVRRSALTKPL